MLKRLLSASCHPCSGRRKSPEESRNGKQVHNVIQDLVASSIAKVYDTDHNIVLMKGYVRQMTSLIEKAKHEAEHARDTLKEDSPEWARAEDIIRLLSIYETDRVEFEQTVGILSSEDTLQNNILKLPKPIIHHFIDIIHLVADNMTVWMGDSATPARVPNPFRMLCETVLRRISHRSGIVPSIMVLPEPHWQMGRAGTLWASSPNGLVYKDIWQGQYVAKKMIPPPDLNRKEEVERKTKLFLREMVVWRQLSHPNIVPLLGILEWDASDGSQQFCMVSPWAQHGTIRQVLRGTQPLDPLATLIKVADALSYLHVAHHPQMAHGDIHPGNILIGEYLEPLLTEFGLSRFRGNHTVTMTNGGKGYVPYKSPEILAKTYSDWTPTTESDMYAFGSLCFEVYTRNAPWQGCKDIVAEYMVMDKQRPDRPSQADQAKPDEIWEIIQSCWAHEANDRMSSTDAWRAMTDLHAVAKVV